MLDFSHVSNIEIPEGNAKQIVVDGVTIWKKGSVPPPAYQYVYFPEMEISRQRVSLDAGNFDNIKSKYKYDATKYVRYNNANERNGHVQFSFGNIKLPSLNFTAVKTTIYYRFNAHGATYNEAILQLGFGYDDGVELVETPANSTAQEVTYTITSASTLQNIRNRMTLLQPLDVHLDLDNEDETTPATFTLYACKIEFIY